MVFYKQTTALGTNCTVPIFTFEERQKIKDVGVYARDIHDKETEGIISDLLEKVDNAEAVIRNLHKTLSAYRKTIPRIIRALNKKKKGGQA